MMARAGTRAAKWLLLVMLVVGVCGMHTLGHVSSGHGPLHGVSAVAGPGGEGAALPAMDPDTVCLAVLTSMSFHALALVRGWVKGWSPPSVRVVRQGAGVARAPPRITSCILRI
jgi:hypothetical protein